MKANIAHSDILLIMVIYKEEITSSSTFISLHQRFDLTINKFDLYIYDNSPANFPQINISQIKSPYNITYVRDVTNPGVSKGYNKGASHATKLNKRYILLLDQDTKFPPNSLDLYLMNLNRYPNQQLFAPTLSSVLGVLSPGKSLLYRSSILSKILNPGVNSLKKKSLLNSGLLINLNLFNLVKGYHEKIPLDFSDTYFIEKIKNVIKDFILVELLCSHSLSTENTKYSSVLLRFKYYCLGAKHYSKISNKFWVYFWCLTRCVKLTFKYQKLSFIEVYIKSLG